MERITKKSFHDHHFHTHGVHLEVLKTPTARLVMWEIGGAESFIRTLWDVYTRDSDAIVFVIDSTAPELFPTVKDLFIDHVVSQSHLRHVPVLLLANKQDLPKAASELEIAERLELHELVDDRPWAFFGTSAVTGKNIDAITRWLIMATRIRSTLIMRDNLTEKRHEKALFQLSLRFTARDALSTPWHDRRASHHGLALDELDPHAKVIASHLVLPHAYIYVQRFLHHDIRKHVHKTLTAQLARMYPSLFFHIMNEVPSAESVDRSWELKQFERIEEMRNTIEQLKHDWTSQELIATTLRSETHENHIATRVVLHVRPLLQALTETLLGSKERSLAEWEFMLRTLMLSPLIACQLGNLSRLQDLITRQWESFLDIIDQKLLEFSDKAMLAMLLEYNLPKYWTLDYTTHPRQWIVYRKAGTELPGPPFYLNILLENPREPRVQAVLSCQDCQQPLMRTSFIPCIVLPPQKKIKLIDHHPIPVSDHYLLTFAKIMVLVLYAESLLADDDDLRITRDFQPKMTAPPVEMSIKMQFLEKFGSTCNHYRWT